MKGKENSNLLNLPFNKKNEKETTCTLYIPLHTSLIVSFDWFGFYLPETDHRKLNHLPQSWFGLEVPLVWFIAIVFAIVCIR